jgi:hypothetical protein
MSIRDENKSCLPRAEENDTESVGWRNESHLEVVHLGALGIEQVLQRLDFQPQLGCFGL